MKKTTLKTKEARQVVNEIYAHLRKGDEVRIYGLGTFKIKKVKKHVGRNPKTGEPMEIAARQRVDFKKSRVLRGLLL